MKNLLIVLALTLMGCSSVDPQVKLLGQYTDTQTETRWELYIRAANTNDSSQLKHNETSESLTISEENIKYLVNRLRKCENNPELLSCPTCKRPY